MKSILMSIKPKWVEKILNGEKTIEIRKKFPKDYVGWVYIYCTKSQPNLKDLRDVPYFQKFVVSRSKIPTKHTLNGKVVARFWVDKVEEIENLGSQNIFITDTLDCVKLLKKSCLYKEELDKYLIKEYEDTKGYAIHIGKLKICDGPQHLGEFGLNKAPQNYCYIIGE